MLQASSSTGSLASTASRASLGLSASSGSISRQSAKARAKKAQKLKEAAENQPTLDLASLRKQFDEFDVSGDGVLDREEATAALCKLGE
jgi:cytidylate kinase